MSFAFLEASKIDLYIIFLFSSKAPMCFAMSINMYVYIYIDIYCAYIYCIHH